MARNRKYNNKEQDLLQKLKRENEKLKKRIGALRKQLQRIDIERYNNLKEILHKHSEEDYEDQIKQEQSKLRKKWECRECREGFLKLYTISRLDGLYYYRKCTSCANRTKVKPYNDKVEGIKDE